MLSEGDIKSVLYKVVMNDPILSLIPEIEIDNHSPVKEGAVTERIVVVLPGGIDNGQFSRSFPRICIYVPYINYVNDSNMEYYTPNGKRLTELQNHCIAKFRSGEYVQEHYCLYRLDTITTEDDPETWSSIINVRLRFETVNTKL